MDTWATVMGPPLTTRCSVSTITYMQWLEENCICRAVASTSCLISRLISDNLRRNPNEALHHHCRPSLQKPRTSMATTPFPVTVHPYPSKVKHACAYELGSSPARNALIFVGGLGDGPHTVPYIRAVAAKIAADTGLSYSVFEIRIRSSFCGFGWNNLAKDVQDISSLVKYLRGIGKEKVVLMGHSTGSQVCALLCLSHNYLL